MFKVLLIYVFCFFTYTLHSQVSIDVYTDTQKIYNFYVTKQTLDFSCGNIRDKESLFQCDYTRVRSYYFNNVLKEEYSFKKEGFIIGEYRSYYANGQLSTFYTCEGGNKVDFYLEFYDNGKKKVAGIYKIFKESPIFKYVVDTNTIIDSLTGFTSQHITFHPYVKDIKDGDWYYWDSTGSLIKKELWRRGKLIKVY